LDVLGPLVDSDHPRAAASIARQLNLSPRMVRTSLAACEHWLRGQDILIRRIPGSGYALVGTPQARRELAAAIKNYKEPLPWLSAPARLRVILLNLLFATGPLQLKQLQGALGVSRTTVIRVLAGAEDWLAARGLLLIRRQNFGCLIAGDERNWRDAVIDLLRETCGDARLLMILRGNERASDAPTQGTLVLQQLLSRVFAALEVTVLRRSVLPVDEALELKLTDREYIDLFLYLALAAYRHRQGKSILSSAEFPASAEADKRLAAARRIVARLRRYLDSRLPEAEMIGIAHRLPPKRPQPQAGRRRGKRRLPTSEPPLRELVERIIQRASLSLHPGLRADSELVHNLTAHVAGFLEEPPGGRPKGGSAQGDVEHVYPYMFSVARQCSLDLDEYLGRQSSGADVANLAVCLVAAMERLRQVDGPGRKVLIVCSEGAVTAWLLVSRLRTEFPDVEVADVISALEFERRANFDGIDVIIATIPLQAGGIPCLQVDPLLRLEDCKHLRALFEGRALELTRQGTALPAVVHLSSLLTADRIQVGIACRSWPEVVDQAAQPLLASGAVDRRFVTAMKEVILENGPYMVIWPGAVLLHARPTGVRHLCMSMANLRTPISFGHADHDPVAVAFVLAAVDNRAHFTALQELNALMQDSTARAQVARTLHKSVILHWVSRYSQISPAM
jgi:transcriptional antiterminator/mannitol/fructose-specific phosphotransferase system IIA component (Ntr-type)